ncbi:hypothetical protein F511_24089 [Dorcoceras hygrometricum]|uniref:Uncharacterized protein n=1 Tax=Dorcoceras hygrometricum TaxID=472368 RepID=A0A2Z7CI15_9LAMI|nr:hypothetical protein F511_24089 [Dorcoceras hygrometricum]
MAPFTPRTRAAATIRMKQIALDNQSHVIHHLRAKLATEGRESAATKEELAKKDIDRRTSQLVESKKEYKSNQVALEASHMTIVGLTEIDLCMSKKIERMKVKKQRIREIHLECHQKFLARIPETKDTIQEQQLAIEALMEENARLLQTIQGLQEDNGAPFDDE